MSIRYILLLIEASGIGIIFLSFILLFQSILKRFYTSEQLHHRSVDALLCPTLFALGVAALLSCVYLRSQTDKCDTRYVTLVGNATSNTGSITVYAAKSQVLPPGGGHFALSVPYDKFDTDGYTVLLSVNDHIIENTHATLAETEVIPVKFRPVLIEGPTQHSRKGR